MVKPTHAHPSIDLVLCLSWSFKKVSLVFQVAQKAKMYRVIDQVFVGKSGRYAMMGPDGDLRIPQARSRRGKQGEPGKIGLARLLQKRTPMASVQPPGA